MVSCYRITLGWPGLIFLFIWLGGNAALFVTRFIEFIQETKFIYTVSLVGLSINFSKGAAEALNFNCALILLPVCKNFISMLRSCCGYKSLGPKVIGRQLDSCVMFHKLIGYAICFWTAVHYIGHAYNLERFIEAAASKDEDDLNYHLSQLPPYDNGTWVNPVRTDNTNAIYEVITMLPGWTGIAATLILIIMVSTAMESVRRKFHEIFWYTHHLFILFFAFIILHGFGGVVRSQSNHDVHDPKNCSNMTKDWGQTESCPWPEFSPHVPETWKWVTGPLILYGIECIIKTVNRFRKVQVIDATIHPNNVLEVKMLKSGFKSSAGKYVNIMCPSLSFFQWHPFTLTSAPEDDFASVHIKADGDWTKKLLKSYEKADKENNSIGVCSYPRISIDGPYGTCCEDVFRYKVVMLVGTGIGVTPFASILRHIWHVYKNGDKIDSVKKVYFYWACRDMAFMWFKDMMENLEKEIKKAGHGHFISIQIFHTQGLDDDMRKQLIETVDQPKDLLTGLNSPTSYGRPFWKREFETICSNNPKREIGVFCCGAKALTKELRRQCAEHSNIMKTRFIFHKEHF